MTSSFRIAAFFGKGKVLIKTFRRALLATLIILVAAEIWMQKILFEKTFANNVSETNDLVIKRSNIELSSGSTAQFIFVAGVEGSGHHLYKTVFKKSPSFERLRKWGIHPNLTEFLQATLYNPRNQEKGIWSAPCKYGNSTGTALFQTLVDTLINIDNIVKCKSMDDNLPPLERTAIPLNSMGIPIGMMSYPNFGGKCRHLQRLDLGILYEACDEAKVECGHIIMHRDAYEVIKSTTMKRKFDTAVRQIVTLSTMLDVINAQMLNFPDRLLACWNYDNVHDAGLATVGELLGWANDGKNFETMFLTTYERHDNLTEREKEQIVPPDMDIYMKQLVRGMERLGQSCAAQIRNSKI